MVEDREAIHTVGRDHRNADLDPTAGANERCNAEQGDVVKAKDTAEQGPPGHRDCHDLRDLCEGPGESLRGLDQEDRVRGATIGTGPRGTARRLGHAGGIGVDTDHQRTGLAGCAGERCPAVTGAEIDDHPVSPGDQLVDLADVDVDDAPADDLLHADILANPSEPLHSRVRHARDTPTDANHVHSQDRRTASCA